MALRRNALHALEEQVTRQRQRIGELERELARVSPQVAALESRLEDLRQLVERPPTPGADENTPSDLLARVERQHEQVRVRISAAARFEERLRKLEDLRE